MFGLARGSARDSAKNGLSAKIIFDQPPYMDQRWIVNVYSQQGFAGHLSAVFAEVCIYFWIPRVPVQGLVLVAVTRSIQKTYMIYIYIYNIYTASFRKSSELRERFCDSRGVQDQIERNIGGTATPPPLEHRDPHGRRALGNGRPRQHLRS